MNSTPSIDPLSRWWLRFNYAPPVGALSLYIYVFLASPMSLAAKIHSCQNAKGERVFQDSPCRFGLTQHSNAQTDPSQWTRALRERGSCSVRSPTLALRWVRESSTVEFEGGAYLLLRGSGSGIAASMVLEAVWPAEQQEVAKPPPVFSDAAKSDPATQATKPVLEVRRVELSGDISGHAVLPEGHAGFIVDTMDDPTRMRFGYFQTNSLIRALRKAPSMSFRLTLRQPEVTLTTDAVPLDGLSEAVRSLEQCQRGGK